MPDWLKDLDLLDVHNRHSIIKSDCLHLEVAHCVASVKVHIECVHCSQVDHSHTDVARDDVRCVQCCWAQNKEVLHFMQVTAASDDPNVA